MFEHLVDKEIGRPRVVAAEEVISTTTDELPDGGHTRTAAMTVAPPRREYRCPCSRHHQFRTERLDAAVVRALAAGRRVIVAGIDL